MPSVLQELVDVIRKEESALFSGECHLSLVSPVLSHLTSDLVRLPYLSSPELERSETPTLAKRAADHAKRALLVENLQYMGFIADRVQALKVIHGSGTLRGTVSLQPFRSLRFLELKRLPLHLLKGLTNLRGQLECVACIRSLQSLDLLLVKCGGDASQGFEWSKLKTLVCVDCDIEELGHALDFAPSICRLDLSRNAIRHCKNAFGSLEELFAVNLNHNFIENIPKFNSRSTHLRILSLRNNRLESINGLEDLEHLQELDLSENCIADHRLLWPLGRLSHLSRLSLSGNPICFHSSHRTLCLASLHANAVKHRQFVLDGFRISRSEAAAIPVDSQLPIPRSISPQEALALSIETISDSQPVSFIQDDQLLSNYDDISSSVKSSGGRRKQIRVRTVRLDDTVVRSDGVEKNMFLEPSSSILSSSTSSAFAQDVEDLRQRFGEEWLKFHAAQDQTAFSAPIPIEIYESTEPEFQVLPDTEQDTIPVENIPALAVRSESIEEPPHTDSNENESHPFLLQLEEKPDAEDALLVTVGDIHLIERNISGIIVEMLELKCILKSEIEMDARHVTVYFDYMRKDRRRRKYVFEDEEQALEFTELIKRVVENRAEAILNYQCLQCGKIFPEYRAESKVRYQSSGNFSTGYSSPYGSASFSAKGALTETLACPFCSGEMLVQRKSDSSDSDSPVDTADTKMNVEEDDEKSEVTPRKRRKRSNSVSILANEPTDDEETLLPSSYRSPSVFSGETKSPSTADVRGEGDQVYHRHGSSEETLFIVRSVDEALDLLRTQVNSQEKGDIEWNFENCRAIDHRLRLYIDMEILKEPSERFEIMLKTRFISIKSVDDADCLLVISNLSVHVYTTGENYSQDPSTWLTLEEIIPLQSINLLHQVCEGECLRLGLTDGSFRLIVLRDQRRCLLFCNQFEDVLAAQKVPFQLREDSHVNALESQLELFPIEDGDVSKKITLATLVFMGKSPATLLCTESHLIITRHDYHQLLRGGNSAVTFVDAKPISSISCMTVQREHPTDVGIKFFEEDPDLVNQWDFHVETVDGLERLIQAIREPWENLIFHVPLGVEVQAW